MSSASVSRVAGRDAGGSNDQSEHARRLLVQAHFLPQVVFAKVVSVITAEHDDGIVAELKALEFVENPANLGVHEGDGGIVGAVGHDCFLAVIGQPGPSLRLRDWPAFGTSSRSLCDCRRQRDLRRRVGGSSRGLGRPVARGGARGPPP